MYHDKKEMTFFDSVCIGAVIGFVVYLIFALFRGFS